MPSDRATFLALADRVEKATGPDRELGARLICLQERGRFLSVEPGPFGHIKVAIEWGDGCRDELTRLDPTASIDAAMSLVPDGCGLKLERYWRAEPGIWWTAVLSWGAANTKRVGAEDATSAALAIAAASLRARAYMGDANA